MNNNIKLTGGVEMGAIFPTNYGDVVVTNVVNNTSVQICFLNPIYQTTVIASDLRKGSVKNPMKPMVYGVGFIGVGPYSLKGTKSYSTWRNMLKRVYGSVNKTQIRQYNGTSVHPHWYNFQNFAEWYHNQIDHFGPVDFRWNIDKDLLVPGNREYGPDTCCVIPEQINTLLVDHAFARGNLPLGVTRIKRFYQVSINKFGQQTYVGRYPSIRSAQLAYWAEKFKIIQQTTIMYWNYIPESLAMRFINFGWEDAFAYYGDDARLWEDEA